MSVIAALSVPEHIFLLCDDQIQISCAVITQNGESRRDLLLSVTNRKALAPGGHSLPSRTPL